MPSGDKSKYTDKQKRQAEHIEEGYRERGVPEGEAEARVWASVNKIHGGGKRAVPGAVRPSTKSQRKKEGEAAVLVPRAAPLRRVVLRRKKPPGHAPVMLERSDHAAGKV